MLFALNARKDLDSFKQNVFVIINFINRIVYAINAKTGSNAVFIAL